MQEALILSQFQVADAMLEGNGTNDMIGNCLHGDGTSKYHRHFQNFQVTTKSGKTLSFGLSEVAGGDAASVLQNFSETIDDLCDVISSNDEIKAKNFAKLVSSIKTTMSDLGPVNPLFNAQLKSLRENLLPVAIENWDELTDLKKDDLKDMGNFFCKLHLLANFATETDKVLNTFEKLLLTDDYETVFAFNTKESGATRLIRTACKALHVRGSDEAGVASYFNSFLAGQNEKSHFAPFVGNRFNILFYNAASLYYHKDSIISFLKSWPNPNNLLKAVNEDITNQVFLAEVRALGIVDKLLTGPLWRLIESSESILKISPFLLRLKLRLADLCKDASSLFNNKYIFDKNDAVIHDEGEVFKKLFEETNNSEFDILTQQALEVIFHAVLVIIERQCADQLPGGKYWNPSENIAQSASIVPVTNKASESDFAILDLLVRTKPSATVQTMQALTMWARNDTLAWLDSKSYDEKVMLQENARCKVNQMKDKYNERKKTINQAKEERLLAKQAIKKDQEEKEALKKTSAVNSLIQLNVRAWISVKEAQENILLVDEKLRSEVILAQFNFYKHVINFKCTLKLFNKTKVLGNKRVNIGWKELLENLIIIIKASHIQASKIIYTSIKPRELRDGAVERHKKELMDNIKSYRLSQKTKQQKSDMLPKFLADPTLFVGSVIQHRVKEEDEEEVFWERGEVMSIDKSKANPKQTTYFVTYDNEPDKRWSFTLLVDFDKGDIIILSNVLLN